MSAWRLSSNMSVPEGFGDFDMEKEYLFKGEKVKPVRKVSYPTLEVEYTQGDKKGVKEKVSVLELTSIESDN